HSSVGMILIVMNPLSCQSEKTSTHCLSKISDLQLCKAITATEHKAGFIAIQSRTLARSRGKPFAEPRPLLEQPLLQRGYRYIARARSLRRSSHGRSRAGGLPHGEAVRHDAQRALHGTVGR